jgi:hypothetical protein
MFDEWVNEVNIVAYLVFSLTRQQIFFNECWFLSGIKPICADCNTAKFLDSEGKYDQD